MKYTLVTESGVDAPLCFKCLNPIEGDVCFTDSVYGTNHPCCEGCLDEDQRKDAKDVEKPVIEHLDPPATDKEVRQKIKVVVGNVVENYARYVEAKESVKKHSLEEIEIGISDYEFDYMPILN